MELEWVIERKPWYGTKLSDNLNETPPEGKLCTQCTYLVTMDTLMLYHIITFTVLF